jgi:anti-anti-sigma factor
MFTDLELEVRTMADRAEIVARGDIDAESVHELRRRVTAVAGDHPIVALDLTAVIYLDSVGVAALFDLVKRTRVHLVVGDGCLVAGVLALTGLHGTVTRPTRVDGETGQRGN